MSFKTFALAGLLASGSAAAAPLTAYQNLSPAQRLQMTNSGTYVKGSADNFWYALEVDPTSGAIPVVISGGGGTHPIATVLASNNNTSTNVTTAAYVQLIASTSVALTEICISDNSGSIIKVATGAAAAEVPRIYLPAGGSGCYQVAIPSSTRISLEALDATAASGYFLFTGFQ